MIQGLYTASMGMTPLLQKQDQIANNLANINTTGFKQSGLFIKTYHKVLANNQLQPFVNQEIKADEVYIDYSQGSLKQTNQPLDVAIHGSGFFSVMTEEGVQYTRNGNFSISNDGLLVTSDGSRVLGKNGYIRLDPAEKVTITDQGALYQKNDCKGDLRVVDFEQPYRMHRCGESRMRPLLPESKEVPSAGYVLKPGYLEASNVDMIKNMVQMISSYRTFEADQKALHAQDETLDKAVNQVGRLS